MTAAHLLLAALLLPPLLYLPGWALQRRIGAPADALARHFERCAIGALWSGWLALLLADLGWFAPWLHLGLTSLGIGLLAFGPGPRAFTSGPAQPHPRWELPAYAVVLLVALLLVIRPFETVLGVRDAGVYAGTGLAIARTGGLVQHDPLLATWGAEALDPDPSVAGPARQAISNFLIGQPRERYIATRLRAAGFFVYEGQLIEGRVIPQGLHLLPAWIALLSGLGGPLAGLFAPGLLGLLGVWSIGMLGRRLAGPWVGLLAMTLLALNGVQVWFARYSTAETVAQFLIWVGLYFFAGAFGDEQQPAHRRIATAALAGVAIGQVALARLDFFLLGPVVAFLLYLWLTRRWDRRHTALALGLGLMLLSAALHIIFIARAYVFDTAHERLYRDYALPALFSLPFLTPAVRETFLNSPRSALVRPVDLPGGLEAGPWLRLTVELGLGLALLAGLLTLRARPGPLLKLEAWLIQQRRPILNLVAGAILLLGAYAYLVRPAIFDADLLFNTRGGWDDPLQRDPAIVAEDVRIGHMTPDEARTLAGVVLQGANFWTVEPDLAATTVLRERLLAERGAWRGPFSNQTLNWLRLQGYVGAPIRVPVRLWYNEYEPMNWWERLRSDPAAFTSTPAPINPKYLIPLANLVRVGWYLSPLGIMLGIVGYALWWRYGLNRASWLFLSVALVGTVFYVRQTYGTSDQHYIYILRRFVPITYPALSLSMAYALVSLAGLGGIPRLSRSWPGALGRALAIGIAALLIFFMAWTNRPIYAHVEYAGALSQLADLAARFKPGRDVLLMRGGAPVHAESRDVPDLIATPLRFIYGIDAFAVKSTQPGRYATDLAAAAERLRSQGKEVYLLLSASGADLVLPGFALEPASNFTLDLPEFEQLTDQKPHNVAQLSLPFAIYRLVPTEAGLLAALPSPLAPTSFAAQVTGLYRPEQRADGTIYAWTNGDATLRLPWPAGTPSSVLQLELAAGPRPAHLGLAQVCLSALPEDAPWPTTSGTPVSLGCLSLGNEPAIYRLQLDPALLPPTSSGSLLVRLESEAWVPAAEDARQNDRRAVGVQLGTSELLGADRAGSGQAQWHTDR